MKKIAAAIAGVFALLMVGSAVWPFPNFGTTSSGTPESITIGLTPYEYSELIYVAEDQGFFTGNGLNVIIRDYNTTSQAIDGLLNDETDIAFTSEYAFVGKVLKKENISLIGNIDKYQSVYLIGRKDRGIENITDLEGKKIGLTRGTIGEFYLGRFLNLHDMSMQDVTLVDLQPSQYVQAFTNGSVDVLITVNKFIDQIQERLGNNTVLWSAQSSQPAFYVMACRNDWAASHPEQIKRFLKSLDQAEEYTINHPDDAKSIVQRRLNYSDAYAATMWTNHQFSLTLDQSLIAAMEDEARWMIKNNLTTGKTMPDFRDHIYTKGLEEVKPDAMNIW